MCTALTAFILEVWGSLHLYFESNYSNLNVIKLLNYKQINVLKYIIPFNIKQNVYMGNISVPLVNISKFQSDPSKQCLTVMYHLL